MLWASWPHTEVEWLKSGSKTCLLKREVPTKPLWPPPLPTSLPPPGTSLLATGPSLSNHPRCAGGTMSWEPGKGLPPTHTPSTSSAAPPEANIAWLTAHTLAGRHLGLVLVTDREELGQNKKGQKEGPRRTCPHLASWPKAAFVPSTFWLHHHFYCQILARIMFKVTLQPKTIHKMDKMIWNEKNYELKKERNLDWLDHLWVTDYYLRKLTKKKFLYPHSQIPIVLGHIPVFHKKVNY